MLERSCAIAASRKGVCFRYSRRNQRDESVAEMTCCWLETKWRSKEHDAASALRCQGSKNGCERAAERVTNEERRCTSRLSCNPRNAFGDGLPVLIEPVVCDVT